MRSATAPWRPIRPPDQLTSAPFPSSTRVVMSAASSASRSAAGHSSSPAISTSAGRCVWWVSDSMRRARSSEPGPTIAVTRRLARGSGIDGNSRVMTDSITGVACRSNNVRSSARLSSVERSCSRSASRTAAAVSHGSWTIRTYGPNAAASARWGPLTIAMPHASCSRMRGSITLTRSGAVTGFATPTARAR